MNINRRNINFIAEKVKLVDMIRFIPFKGIIHPMDGLSLIFNIINNQPVGIHFVSHNMDYGSIST